MEPAGRVEAPPPSPPVDAAAPAPANPDRRTSTSEAKLRDAIREELDRAREARTGADSSLARVKPEAAAQAAAESVAVSGLSRAPGTVASGAANPGVASRLAARQDATIVSSDSSTVWRIGAAGTVLRSTDEGTTWETQATGVSARLTAGSAPSQFVCWLVGDGGVVLVTIDGRSWQRLAFPETIDLAAVRAEDDRTATVTATDGRSFTTDDRGQTWKSTRD
jgi:photosystem II stability/assembly factor-like uncharacterized protein